MEPATSFIEVEEKGNNNVTVTVTSKSNTTTTTTTTTTLDLSSQSYSRKKQCELEAIRAERARRQHDSVSNIIHKMNERGIGKVHLENVNVEAYVHGSKSNDNDEQQQRGASGAVEEDEVMEDANYAKYTASLKEEDDEALAKRESIVVEQLMMEEAMAAKFDGVGGRGVDGTGGYDDGSSGESPSKSMDNYLQNAYGASSSSSAATAPQDGNNNNNNNNDGNVDAASDGYEVVIKRQRENDNNDGNIKVPFDPPGGKNATANTTTPRKKGTNTTNDVVPITAARNTRNNTIPKKKQDVIDECNAGGASGVNSVNVDGTRVAQAPAMNDGSEYNASVQQGGLAQGGDEANKCGKGSNNNTLDPQNQLDNEVVVVSTMAPSKVVEDPEEEEEDDYLGDVLAFHDDDEDDDDDKEEEVPDAALENDSVEKKVAAMTSVGSKCNDDDASPNVEGDVASTMSQVESEEAPTRVKNTELNVESEETAEVPADEAEEAAAKKPTREEGEAALKKDEEEEETSSIEVISEEVVEGTPETKRSAAPPPLAAEVETNTGTSKNDGAMAETKAGTSKNDAVSEDGMMTSAEVKVDKKGCGCVIS